MWCAPAVCSSLVLGLLWGTRLSLSLRPDSRIAALGKRTSLHRSHSGRNISTHRPPGFSVVQRPAGQGGRSIARGMAGPFRRRFDCGGLRRRSRCRGICASPRSFPSPDLRPRHSPAFGPRAFVERHACCFRANSALPPTRRRRPGGHQRDVVRRASPQEIDFTVSGQKLSAQSAGLHRPVHAVRRMDLSGQSPAQRRRRRISSKCITRACPPTNTW